VATRAQTRRITADERRAVITRVAADLFARHGYAGTRLEDIAAAAAVTKPIVYRHFDSKKALYMSLLAKHEQDLPTFFEQLDVPSEDGSSDALVRAILERWLDYVRENRHAWVMLFRDSSGDDEIRTRRRQVSMRARQVMGAFIARWSGIPAQQVEPTAELLTSGLAGLALWWIDHPDVPKPVVLEVAARMSAPAIGAQRRRAEPRRLPQRR
jgi:AcrR family transcriptional regulator